MSDGVLAFPVRITNILEHHRTIRGGKDTMGQVYTEQVNLGWFLHLELLNGEPFGVALGMGNDRPEGVAVGDELVMRLGKS
jgi:hypothetical protein